MEIGVFVLDSACGDRSAACGDRCGERNWALVNVCVVHVGRGSFNSMVHDGVAMVGGLW